MRPTSLRTLALLAVVPGVLAYLLAEQAVGRLELPVGAPVTLALLAVVELALAKVVRDRISHRRRDDGRPAGRPLHPMQIARAAVLAKASSPAGAVLLGGYAGLTAWTAPRRETLPAYAPDPLVAGLSAAACLALVAAALLLERACRTPEPPGPPVLPGQRTDADR